MDYVIDTSFIRDTKKAPRQIQQQVDIILDEIKKAKKLTDLSKVKKMAGSRTAYRIKLDDYRLGFYVADGVIVLSRLLARKEMYRYFPKK